MATLTYNPNEQAEGELNAEEQEALEVGEKLAEQQSELLAGKFKDAEALEQGYIELQKKLGSQEEEAKEEATETKDEKVEEDKDKDETEEIDTSFLNTLWDEAVDGKYKDETLQKLANMDTRELAQMYLKERADTPQQSQGLSEDNVKNLKGVVGGEDGYTEMMGWAGDNLTADEISMYDTVMDKGDPLAAYFAVQALAYRFNDSRGVDGQMLQGKAVSEKGDVFKSQAQVVEAMTDPRYDKDPAYRQELYNKLERSNLQF